MNGFVFIAILLTLLALAVVLYPLLRRGTESPVAWRSAGLLVVVVIAGSAGLYPLWSNWDWDRPMPAADSPEGMVGRLARRLEKEPNDLEGWLKLGRSYAVLEQYSLAARAYQRADTLAQGKNFEAVMGLAETLANADSSQMGGRAGRLFEQALTLDPNSVKALFYGAFAAMERNEIPLARARFQRLLEGNPPEQVRGVIEQQIRSLDAMATLVAAPQPGAAAPTAAQPAAATAPTVSIALRVTMAAAVAAKAEAGAPLFVLARVPGQRGPPLAAKRLDAKFPLNVELLSTDAMIAGSGFTAGQELEIEARVANGGSAISRSGDPFGVARVKAGSKDRVSIEINQLKP